MLAVLAAWLFTPAAFRDAALQDDGAGSVAVEFRISKAALLDSVTADLDGRPVGVQMPAPDTYKIDVPANGALTLTARTIAGRVTTWQADITAVDSMPPKVVRDETRDGMMYIYFADEGAAGIDWASLTVTGAESSQAPAGVDVRQEEACLAFPFPAEPVRISLADRRGNPLTVLLQPAAAQPHAKPASITPPRTTS